MAVYTGLVCDVCGRPFLADDDVVVCPVCGTPHHRECYSKLGKCVNTDWHSENKTYDAAVEKARIEGPEKNEEQSIHGENEEETVCPRCGNKNSSYLIFCSRCGSPLSEKFSVGQRPGQGTECAGINIPVIPIDPEDEIEEVKVWKLSAVVKENQYKFILHFKMLSEKKGNTSFNFAAFFFAPFYFFYRKMYGIGVAALAIFLALEAPSVILHMTNEYLTSFIGEAVNTGIELTAQQYKTLSTVSMANSFLLMVFQILCGIFAYRIYFNRCKKLCGSIDASVHSRQEFEGVAYKKGGVNRVLVLVFVILYAVAAWLSILFSSTVGFFSV